MSIKIHEGNVELLEEYSQVSISYEVQYVFRVEPIDQGLGGIRLAEEKLPQSYLKDYDEHGEGDPRSWPEKFDIRNWGILVARVDGQTVGGAAVAFNTNGVNMLEGRRDLAVLWDIRVNPAWRGKGVGKALLQHSAGWARQRGCRQLKIETQNVNVPACHFYASQGCELGVIHRYGYAGHPTVGHEVMLIWYLPL